MTAAATLNVMIVDDSAILRRILADIVNSQKDMQVVWTASNGQEALTAYKHHRPDVVLMDIEMPVMDGMTALREMLRMDARARIIMCSQWTGDGAMAALEALEAGAADCIGKPSTGRLRGDSFAWELLGKLRNAAEARPQSKPKPSPPPRREAPLPAASNIRCQAAPALREPQMAEYTLRPLPALPVGFASAIAIGASTGGPRALIELLSRFDKKLDVPVFITQHIPVGFSAYLAKAIASKTPFPTVEAQEDMEVQPGTVYIAPSGTHMGLRRHGKHSLRITLIGGGPVNYCKPSIEVMLKSIHAAYPQGGIITVLLTGMGNDGEKGCRDLLQHPHNTVLAQDRESSVVWGIPGAAAQNGLCHAVLPLVQLGPAVTNLLHHRRLPG